MKQTAVEWLIEQLHSGKELSTVIRQAKAMEKEQISDCYTEANTELTNEDGSFITGEQYYNETFKQD